MGLSSSEDPVIVAGVVLTQCHTIATSRPQRENSLQCTACGLTIIRSVTHFGITEQPTRDCILVAMGYSEPELHVRRVV